VTGVSYGAKLPNSSLVAGADSLRRFVTGVEGIGFDHLSMDDHVAVAPMESFPTNPSGYTTVRAEHELFTSLAYLAGVTQSLQFRTGVLILPQRQTVLVARQAAEVDVLAGGRLTLGVGLGWNSLEFEALGESFTHRARRFESQIEVLRKLWTNEYVTHADDWHALDRTGILPRPLQQPIPIWIGASAEPAIRRATRIGDGFMPLGRMGRGAERQVKIYLDERVKLGRDSAPLQLEGWIDLDNRGPDAWKSQADTWTELGATHITLVTAGRDDDTVDRHLELLRAGLHAITT
jgi:probable F420-dependent oxidoreductase